MRYLMMVKGDENFAASGPPPKSLMEAIDVLYQDAARDGKIESMGGLRHSSRGASVRIRKGKVAITDGPFTEAKEIIGGFTIMRLASLEEAKEEARKFMELHVQHWPGWDGECEVREMMDETDFV